MTQTSAHDMAAPANAGGVASRPVRLVVVRHGRPNLDRNAGPKLDWRAYRDWWSRYEKAPLAEGQAAPDALMQAASQAPFIYSSVRPRALETAAAFANGRDVVSDPLFVEAPLPPPHLPDHWRFLPKTWNMVARACWLMGHSDGDESLTAARSRADDAAEKLVSKAYGGHDVVLAAHGWFNRMLRPALKRRGWSCVHDGGDKYWSFRIYEKR